MLVQLVLVPRCLPFSSTSKLFHEFRSDCTVECSVKWEICIVFDNFNFLWLADQACQQLVNLPHKMPGDALLTLQKVEVQCDMHNALQSLS